jgi:hypothetical protein
VMWLIFGETNRCPLKALELTDQCGNLSLSVSFVMNYPLFAGSVGLLTLCTDGNETT